MTLASFVLAVVALVVALAAEIVKRPRLEVRTAEWEGAGQFPWSFLVVRVFNRRIGRWLGWLFSRHSADGCRVSLTYFHEGRLDSPAVDQIPGRWSAAPEPLTWDANAPRADPSKLPASYQYDVPTTGPGLEVAVARTSNCEAFAFSAESYLYQYRHPGWELRPGRWRVVVRLASSDAQASGSFDFDVSDSGDLAWSDPAVGTS